MVFLVPFHEQTAMVFTGGGCFADDPTGETLPARGLMCQPEQLIVRLLALPLNQRPDLVDDVFQPKWLLDELVEVIFFGVHLA